MAAKPQSNRREFLTGQAALDAVSNLGSDHPEARSRSSYDSDGRDEGSYLIQVDRTAMACEFQILLNAGRDSGATEAALGAMDRIEQLEDQLSWFRETSELARINRQATSRPVVVERRLFELLVEAFSISRDTGGTFDITAGPLWQLWGFHRRAGRMPTEAQIAEALERTGADRIQLDREAQTIQFSRPGVEINLAAIGKGYALDRCAEQLSAAGVNSFLMHGGQSSMLARGSRAGQSPEHPGWTVALRHPLRPDQRLAEIQLHDQALGTSGSGNQFFHHGGKRYGHVLDPRTGWPAETLLSATVLAPTAARADALATAFFVLGLEGSVEYCRQHEEIGALLVASGAQSGSMELVTTGIRPDQWRTLA